MVDSKSDTTPIPPWAPCKRPLGCDYPDCECHSKTTDASISTCERCGMEFVEDEPGADLNEGTCPDCAEAAMKDVYYAE